MTVIILPGGQFAQKGLALHLPSNVQEIASQLPQNVNNTSVFSVKFLHNAYTTEDYKYQVSGFKLKNALIWSKTFNKLYKELKLWNFFLRNCIWELQVY